jgi:hypothetical protein
MSGLLDALGFLACLFGGVWLWTRLRACGLSRLSAAALACLVVWLLGSLISVIWVTAVHLWLGLLTSAAPLLPTIACMGVVIGSGAAGWLTWRHWRARRFFGGR